MPPGVVPGERLKGSITAVLPLRLRRALNDGCQEKAAKRASSCALTKCNAAARLNMRRWYSSSRGRAASQ